jgi:predicted alpha/beta superfamily hydrolase
MLERRSICSLALVLAGCLLLSLNPTGLSQAKAGEGVRIGNVEEIQSKVLGEKRTLLISLPDPKAMSEAQHPVIYLLDGKENFHHLAPLIRFLGDNGRIPKMIVVAIVNTDRVRDFTPTHSDKEFDGRAKTSGGAGKFVQFLKQELFPFVEKKYRTAPYRILVGHSLTGMFTTHVMLSQPAMFNAYVAVGPYLTWDEKTVISKIDKTLKKLPAKDLFFYVSHAGADEAEFEIDSDVKTLCAALKKHAPAGLKWHFSKFEQDNHGSAIHFATADALRHIFPTWPADPKASVEQLLAHYKRLSQQYGFAIPVPEGMLNARGYRALLSKKVAEAIRIFQANVKFHPDSANVYDSLGEAYETDAKIELALKSYKKAVEIFSAQAKPDPRILGVYRKHVSRAEKALAARK